MRETKRASGSASASEAELIQKEWGEYFPITISLFGYNKTTAQMYYPLTKEEALRQGYRWDDYEAARPETKTTISAHELPDDIENVTDDIFHAAIECEVTKKLFKITKQELDFYRRQKIPLPRRHPEERHLDRFAKRNPRRFWKRSCQKCAAGILTTYAPDRPEIVYCEKCYLETVY